MHKMPESIHDHADHRHAFMAIPLTNCMFLRRIWCRGTRKTTLYFCQRHACRLAMAITVANDQHVNYLLPLKQQNATDCCTFVNERNNCDGSGVVSGKTLA